ncbi:MAG: hypothetical protein IJ326_09300 [Lachnospiraceae bacterium]|nr:hypothetical protein [Lachnospiraceae bacterium]
MKIWKLKSELGEYESFQLLSQDKDFLKDFKDKILSGQLQKGKLENLELELVEGEKYSDLPKLWSCSGILMFSERAKECLDDLLGNSVEYVEARTDNKTFYIVNILEILDAINYEEAVLRRLDTGLVVGFDKYSFLKEKIQNLHMFKVLLNGKIYSTEIYVTEELKEKVEMEQLIGFKFELVWDSEQE